MISPQRQKRPRHWRKVLLAIATLLVGMLASASWYRFHYSMSAARPLEVQGSPSGPRVLIATQGSTFKDAITTGLIEQLKKKSAHIKVVDVTALANVHEGDWDAVVVVHTWEIGKPPKSVRAFIDRLQQRDKLVVLTTSGAGTFRMEGVDAISSASTMSDVPFEVAQLSNRLDAILNRAGDGRSR
jgi:hypothetical protein